MQPNRGFTAIDLLVVVGTIAVFVGLIAPRVLSTRCRSSRINCVSNIKQVGIAFRMWANDHGEAFPMAVPFVLGGGREFALAGQPAAVFRIIEKELNTPKVLYCRYDAERFRTNCFSGMTEQNLSYLLGIDANVLDPQAILTGDRNLTVDGAQLGRGLTRIAKDIAVGWSRKIHSRQGNIGLADGSASQMNENTLQRQIALSQLTTNRFAIP